MLVNYIHRSFRKKGCQFIIEELGLMLFGFIDPKSDKKGERQSYRKWKSQLDAILIS